MNNSTIGKLNNMDADGEVDSATRQSILNANSNLVYVKTDCPNPNLGRFTKLLKNLKNGSHIIEDGGNVWNIPSRWTIKSDSQS